MSSRDDILGRVRAKLGRNESNAASGRAAIAATLAVRMQGPRPLLDDEKSTPARRQPAGASQLTSRFIDKSLAYSSSVDQVASLADVPVAIAKYLQDRQLPAQAVVWPQLAALDWADAGLTVAARGAEDADLVGITGCFCAIAETGTLMLCGAADKPASVSLLPETHIAIVPVSRIVAGMEEAFALARDELGLLPRAVNFISGPSRTGDIEQTIVLGAHGPYRVHLVICQN
jgi:L-lactate dehydrogenase complex protein LldG